MFHDAKIELEEGKRLERQEEIAKMLLLLL
jgi:hypothetical protein